MKRGDASLVRDQGDAEPSAGGWNPAYLRAGESRVVDGIETPLWT